MKVEGHILSIVRFDSTFNREVQLDPTSEYNLDYQAYFTLDHDRIFCSYTSFHPLLF